MEMKTIYDGKTVDVVGFTLLSHKRTGKQKRFLVIKAWDCRKNEPYLTTMATSEVRGMTQKKAAMLRHIIYRDVKIDTCTANNGYV